MSSKKIKLKTSITKINAKANPKKKKSSTKLKLILADPHKCLIPTLSPQNAGELCNFVHLEISSTSVPGRECAKRCGISLGMASSLRAISNRTTACVLASNSVKPKFILQQIAYFARQRNSKAKIFLVTNLEELSKKMFGIRSTIMAFANNTSPQIADWIARQSSPKDKKAHAAAIPVSSVDDATKPSPFNKFDLNSALLRKNKNGERVFVPGSVINYNQQIIDNRIKSTRDYMSFSAPTYHPKQNIRVTDAEVQEGRINMLKKLNKISNRTQHTEISYVDKNKKESSKTNPTTSKLPKIVYEEYDSSYVKFKTLSFLSNKRKSKKKEKS